MWTAGCRGDGYGAYTIVHGQQVAAHRHAYVLAYGEIPDGMYVLHKCDTPRCVNPDHLFLGTNDDNMHDMVLKRRSALGERNPRGKLFPEQVLEIRRLCEEGVPQKKLAERFGVNVLAVNRVVRRASWRHL